MAKGIKNRGSQVHRVKRDELRAEVDTAEIAFAMAEEAWKKFEEEEKERFIIGTQVYVCNNMMFSDSVDDSKLSQKQRSQLRSYGN